MEFRIRKRWVGFGHYLFMMNLVAQPTSKCPLQNHRITGSQSQTGGIKETSKIPVKTGGSYLRQDGQVHT